jgi:geranylgeranyl pyrophosphate synthase
VRTPALIAVILSALLAACFSESGLRDEAREATRAIDALIDEIEDGGPIREAAGRARDTVDEARAALEDFRENPSAETRRALEDAERRLNDAKDLLTRLLERAPQAIRESLGEVVDALERIGRDVRQAVEG